MNVNSLLSKIDEIRDIANRIKPAVLGITESKLDNSVTNMEVISMVTVSLEMTETDMVVALHVTLKIICASILKKFSPIQLNMYFSKFSSQKLSPLRLEYFKDLQIPMIF